MDDVRVVFDITESVTGLSKKEITSGRRQVPLVDAKRIIGVVLRRHTKMKLWQIGEALGGIDHSCVLHYIKTHSGLMESDYNFRKKFVAVEASFLNCKDTVEVKLDIKLRERREINREISRLRKLLQMKNEIA